MSSLSVGVAGIGLLGPGFADWPQGRHLLATPGDWQAAATVVPAPARLAPTERRRAGLIVKASVVVADQACAMAGIDAAVPATVFTSSTGDPANCHALCETLATPERAMSPTRFTNSVHNAAAGYWHIAVHSMQPSTSLAAFDASVSAGLLEAAAQCVSSAQPVLLVACDLPYPEPLHALRPVADVFALALLLVPMAGATMPRLHLRFADDSAAATRCNDAALEGLRQSIPAARALPLMQALASAATAEIVLDDQPGSSLHIRVEAPRC